MESDIFFSIIIPTYNRAHLIKNTIESVIKQSYKNFELLIIDDGKHRQYRTSNFNSYNGLS